MSPSLKPGSGACPRVIVVGGGVGALETVIALRTLAGERIDIVLIAPERAFGWRSLMVAAAFGGNSGSSIEFGDLAATFGITYVRDAVLQVDTRERRVLLAAGSEERYDALVIAIGAVPEEAVVGALTFGTPTGTNRFSRTLQLAEQGEISDFVFAVPAQAGWPIALYELALLTAERLRASHAAADITLITPEPAPLAVFGGRASGAVLEELEDRNVHFIAGLLPEEIRWGELHARPGKVRINADVVVTLPRLRGPALPGLPADARGFIPIDRHGLVRGLTDVYAAGDVVNFPIKHGGLASQQADAVAETISARVGVDITPAPFRPVLRGMLLTGREPRYLEGSGDGGVASTRPLWWPPAKVAGRYLGAYLSDRVARPPTASGAVEVDETIDSELAVARAVGGRQ
jgi:sulfide:quinone oxidoreductase